MDELTRVAIVGDLAATDGFEVVWLAASGRYVELAPAHRAALAAVAAHDGCGALALLVAASIDPGTLRELADAGLILIWNEQSGFAIGRALVVEAAIANVLARCALRLAPRVTLRMVVDLGPSVAPLDVTWRGVENERLLAAMRVASALPLTDGRCLPSAVGLWLLLRVRRRSAGVRLGATRGPFAAHAWVETAGVALDPAPTVFPGAKLGRAPVDRGTGTFASRGERRA
ncbi:MAG: lasso peptide biosynthesis B2 protein [Solirubrobacteraceae bacterium]